MKIKVRKTEKKQYSPCMKGDANNRLIHLHKVDPFFQGELDSYSPPSLPLRKSLEII